MPIVTAAQGSRSRLLFKKQTGIGVLATGNYNTLRYNTHSLSVRKGGVESGEIRGDREVFDYRHGNRNSSGDINTELIHGDHDALLESLMFSTFTTGTINIGTVPQYLSIEDGQLDIAQFQMYQDMLVSRMQLSVRPDDNDAIVKAVFSLVGSDGGNHVGTSGGGTPAAPSTKAPSAHFAGGIYDDTTFTTKIATVTTLDLTVDNGVEALFAVGQQTPVTLPYGRARVSGNVSFLWDTNVMINRYRNETEFPMSIEVSDPTANKIRFLMGRVKLTSGEIPVAGEKSRIMSGSFMALRDATLGTALRIVKNPV